MCDRDDEYGSDKLKVTILGSEWGSSKGGLSTFNRELAIQLAKSSSVEITFVVPQCSDEDKKEALRHNVHILKATRLSFLPEHLQIDIIIGHGVTLGRQAQVIKKYHKCKWVQFIHSNSKELGMVKPYLNPFSTSKEKHSLEVELCNLADFVVGVGSKLTNAFCWYLQRGKDETIFDFTPGVFDEFKDIKQSPHEKRGRDILLLGGVHEEGYELKGFDIAARAVASLPDTRLVYVSTAFGIDNEIVHRFLRCGVPASRLLVRRFLESRESLREIFCEVDLLLMPSGTEGFGFTGLDALSGGLPVLVSIHSGFGEALTKVPFGSSFVIDSKDPMIWAAAIKKVFDRDREVRLMEAEVLRTSYERMYSWTKQSEALLFKMITLVRGLPITTENVEMKFGMAELRPPTTIADEENRAGESDFMKHSGPKLLKSLLEDTDILETICELLDTPVPGFDDYKAVAKHYGFGYFKIKSLLEKSDEGPSKALIEALVTRNRKLTVEEFAATVEKIAQRKDVAERARFDRAESVWYDPFSTFTTCSL